MNDLMQLATNPLVPKLIAVLIVYWIFNSAMDALAVPDANSSKWYGFFYRFGQRLAGNLKAAGKTLHVPGSEQQQ